MRIRILLLIIVMQICDHWSTDPPRPHSKSLSVHYERSRTSLAPIWAFKAPNFYFNADPDPAFHSNADPDPQSASKK
jgi:hypothetical protein